MGARKYSAEEQRSILEKYEASGLSRVEFSLREGLSKTALYRWGRKRNGGKKFVEVPLIGRAGSRSGSIELELPHGIRLRIGS